MFWDFQLADLKKKKMKKKKSENDKKFTFYAYYDILINSYRYLSM